MATDKSAAHRGAADRHEEAAQSHDRASRFWDERGDWERAELQREMADYERRGAELERRWAEIVDADAVHGARETSDGLRRRTRDDVERLVEFLTRMTDSLDRAAGTAEEHAERHAHSGRDADAAREREAARQARDAAQRARSQAQQWLEMPGERAT
jgi:hypothetical protein